MKAFEDRSERSPNGCPTSNFDGLGPWLRRHLSRIDWNTKLCSALRRYTKSCVRQPSRRRPTVISSGAASEPPDTLAENVSSDPCTNAVARRSASASQSSNHLPVLIITCPLNVVLRINSGPGGTYTLIMLWAAGGTFRPLAAAFPLYRLEPELNVRLHSESVHGHSERRVGARPHHANPVWPDRGQEGSGRTPDQLSADSRRSACRCRVCPPDGPRGTTE